MRSVHSIKPFWITRAAIRITWQIVDQMDDRFFIVFFAVFLAQICHLLMGNKFSIWIHHFSCQIHTILHTLNCSRLLLLHSNEKCGKQFRSYRNGHTTTTDCDLFADGRRSSSSALALHTQTHTHTIIWTGKNGLFLLFFLSFFLSLRSFSWNSEWIEM